MKTLLTLWFAAGLALLAGCALRPLIVQRWIGPQPALTAPPGAGQLVVYTATQVSGYTLTEAPVYSSYRLYNADGISAREVLNRSGSFDQYPQRLALPPGQYRVRGLAQDGGEVTVPVRVEAGRTTEVDLTQVSARAGAAGPP